MPCQQHRGATSFVNKDVDVIRGSLMTVKCHFCAPTHLYLCIKVLHPKFHTCKVEFAIGHGNNFSKHKQFKIIPWLCAMKMCKL
jgi:hypothetical protein